TKWHHAVSPIRHYAYGTCSHMTYSRFPSMHSQTSGMPQWHDSEVFTFMRSQTSAIDSSVRDEIPWPCIATSKQTEFVIPVRLPSPRSIASTRRQSNTDCRPHPPPVRLPLASYVLVSLTQHPSSLVP
ncbi:hypothetical protein PENTCL1PPCAC_12842, partial [Pristionchus entomophagus]